MCWHKLGEVENKYTLEKPVLSAIFMPNFFTIRRNLAKLWQKINLHSFFETRCICFVVLFACYCSLCIFCLLAVLSFAVTCWRIKVYISGSWWQCNNAIRLWAQLAGQQVSSAGAHCIASKSALSSAGHWSVLGHLDVYQYTVRRCHGCVRFNMFERSPLLSSKINEKPLI